MNGGKLLPLPLPIGETPPPEVLIKRVAPGEIVAPDNLLIVEESQVAVLRLTGKGAGASTATFSHELVSHGNGGIIMSFLIGNTSIAPTEAAFPIKPAATMLCICEDAPKSRIT